MTPSWTSWVLRGGTATGVAVHVIVNLRCAGRWVLAEQPDRGHNLSRLAVAALHHIKFHPGLLYGGPDLGVCHGFDRCDLCAFNVIDIGLAGSHGLTIKVDRASAAGGHTAPKLCACQLQFVPDDPQQRRTGFCVDLVCLTVQLYLVRHSALPGFAVEDSRNGSMEALLHKARAGAGVCVTTRVCGSPR